MEDIEDRVDDETEESSEDDSERDSRSEEPAARPATTDSQGGDVESIEELIVKKEERAAQEEDEDDSVLSLTREERLEPLAVKVVPPQPTADIGPVAFVAMAPFLWLVRRVRPRRGALLGLAFGLAYFGALLWWVERFGQLAWSALTIASAVFVAAFGLLAP